MKLRFIGLLILMTSVINSYTQTIEETRDWLNAKFKRYPCKDSETYLAENEKLVSPSNSCHVYYPDQLLELYYKDIKSVSYFNNPYPGSKGVLLIITGSQKKSMWLIITEEDEAKKIVKAIKYLAEQKGAKLIKENLFDN